MDSGSNPDSSTKKERRKMKLKEGQKVRINEECRVTAELWSINLDMEALMGTQQVIHSVNMRTHEVRLKNHEWVWHPDDIHPVMELPPRKVNKKAEYFDPKNLE